MIISICMYFLLAAFVLGDSVTVFAQNNEREFAAEMEQRRMEVQNMLREFERETERRRQEEGEYFDEETAQFERSMMERQAQLEIDQIALEEEFHQRRLDLDRQYQDLERERQEYWESREQQDIEYQRASSDQEADTEDWTSGPNSLSLIVDSIEGDEVVIRIEIADSDPINGWGLQLEYDKNELEFNDFVPGGFIGGSFIPLFKENDKGVQVGGAQLGGQGDMSDGSGVLGSVKLKVIGSLPAWINASSLDLKGDVENEVNLTNSQVEIER
ncbi:MAG: cohesin domain-containing protein [Candidatus Latescibacterota bacterium]|nr:cohesin domain-containing protein [Candidatus Latescibacterota bacterium]